MQAINDYVVVDKIKKGPKKVGGLILTDETDETNRYKKANIISVGNMVEVVKPNDVDNFEIDKKAVSYTHLTLPTNREV